MPIPRELPEEELIVTADQFQHITDASLKYFRTELERTSAYSQRVVNLVTQDTAARPPIVGEPSVQGNLPGIDVWTGIAWRPLRKPSLDLNGQPQVGLIRAEVADAFRVAEPYETGIARTTNVLTLYGDPKSKVTIAYISEEHDPRPVGQRIGTNPDPGFAIINLDFGFILGQAIYDPALSEAENQAAGWSAPTLLAGVPTRTYNIITPVFVDVSAEATERFQVRIFDPINVRIDRDIGVCFIAPSTLPIISFNDPIIPITNQPAVPGETTVQTRATSGNITWTANTALPEAFQVIVNLGDITATVGTDLIANYTNPITLPAGSSTGTIAPFNIPQQVAELTETASYTVHPHPDQGPTAILANRYGIITLQGTIPASRFVSGGIAIGDGYGSAPGTTTGPHRFDLPWAVLPVSAGQGNSVIEWWTEPIPTNTANTSRNNDFYPVVDYANRREFTIRDGTASGDLRLSTRFFRTLAIRTYEDDQGVTQTGEPNDAYLDFRVIFRNKSGPIETKGSRRQNSDVTIATVQQGRIGSTTQRTPLTQLTISSRDGGQVAEGNFIRGRVTISASPAADVSFSVALATGGNLGTAVQGVNFPPQNAATHTFAGGTSDLTWDFQYVSTHVPGRQAEGDTFLHLIIEDGSIQGNAEAAVAQARVTLLDREGGTPDPQIDLPARESITAPTAGAVIASIPVTPNQAVTGTANVSIEEVTNINLAGRAQPGVHYNTARVAGFAGTPTQLSWNNESVSKNIIVQILASTATSARRFRVRISNPVGFILGREIMTFTIHPARQLPTPTALPGVNLRDASGREPAVGADNADLEANLILAENPPAGTTAKITLTTASGGAVPLTDYGPPHNPVTGQTWTRNTATGEYSTTITMPRAGDYPVRLGIIRSDAVRPRRGWRVNLSAAENCRITDQSAQWTIFADRPTTAPPTPGDGPDPPAPVVRPNLSVANGQIDAPTQTMRFIITLDRESTTDTTGTATTVNRDAIAGTHYTRTSVNWRIRGGQLRAIVEVPLLRLTDTVAVSFALQLGNISNNVASTAASRVAIGTIPSAAVGPAPVGPPTVTLTLGAAITARGQSQLFTITRTGTPAQLARPSSVRFRAPLSGSGAEDVIPRTTTLNFPVGTNTRSAGVATRTPTTRQSSETYTAGLDQASNAVIAAGSSNVRAVLPAYTPPARPPSISGLTVTQDGLDLLISGTARNSTEWRWRRRVGTSTWSGWSTYLPLPTDGRISRRIVNAVTTDAPITIQAEARSANGDTFIADTNITITTPGRLGTIVLSNIRMDTSTLLVPGFTFQAVGHFRLFAQNATSISFQVGVQFVGQPRVYSQVVTRSGDTVDEDTPTGWWGLTSGLQSLLSGAALRNWQILATAFNSTGGRSSEHSWIIEPDGSFRAGR